MNRRLVWRHAWTDKQLAQADLFERDLFGARPRRAAGRSAARRPRPEYPRPQNAEPQSLAPPWPIFESAADVPAGVSKSAPRAASAPSPVTGSSRVLKQVRVRLHALGEEMEVAKVLDTSTDRATTRATSISGNPVDHDRKIAEEERAHLRRHRQIHPTLLARLARAGGADRLRVAVWLYVDEDLYDKGRSLRERPRDAAPLVASSEATIAPAPRLGSEPRPGEPAVEPPVDRGMTAYREQVNRVVERAMKELPTATGVRVLERLDTVPNLVVEATAAQVRTLSARPEVVGLFLHEPEGIDDLTNSMRIARATPVISAGWKATNIRVALWEQGPDVLTDLRIEEFYDSTQANKSDHARLTTAVIKNRQSGAPHGYAPDAKIYSANSYDIKALHWAVVKKHCRVVNQSFHRASEETSGAFSYDDLVKDYLATRWPFPTIVHAAGNQSPANTEFVNHKGYNVVVVGNHDDTARHLQPSSVFRNPASTHGDRELPDLCANGDQVTALGLTMSGTSFASPAVAGSVALLQNAANALLNWPEGCRAILLAAAGRNVSGNTWWDDVNRRVDGRDGAGALDTREGVRIARARAVRNAAAARCGWDVGTLYNSDFDANGKSRFRHAIAVPAGGAPKTVRVALAWSSKVTYVDDPTQTPPIKSVQSKLTVDLDLHVYQGTRLVAWSSSFNNTYEVVDFQGTPGTTYDIVIRRWSGTDWVWYGVAWTVF